VADALARGENPVGGLFDDLESDEQAAVEATLRQREEHEAEHAELHDQGDDA
jgi:hypothetical protein